MAELKYSKQMYLESGFWNGTDDNVENAKERLVKCRKPHECMGGCGNKIQPGDYAVLETGFLDNKPVSCYTCTHCIEKWIEEVHAPSKM